MSALLEAQQKLQSAADEVVQRLGLNEALAAFGHPVRVGSSAMGLMVRRDIDITVICKKLDRSTMAAFAELGARYFRMTDVIAAVRLRNDTGSWNVEPERYPDGIYLWLSVRMPRQVMWTVDIWLVDEPERQPDLRHLKTLVPRLTDEDRETILRIKHALTASVGVPSALVYEAVMDHGVRTLDDFELWRDSAGSR